MELSTDKIKCPICHNNFDSSIHIPKILINCGHTICAVCVNGNLLENDHKITCPEDLTLYENLESAEFLPTNKSLLQLIDPLFVYQKESLPSGRMSITNVNNKNDYIRKSSTLRTSLKRSPSMRVCLIHSLPLDVICIDEKAKLCSQCALGPPHSKHTIITDEEFMNQIDLLIDLFSEVDLNVQNLNENDNISAKKILDEIDKKIKELAMQVKENTKEIIHNITEQNDKIISFLNSRQKELHDKFDNTTFDIKDLISQTNTWMDTVKDKLDKLNDINEPSVECVKLIDDDPNKNQMALLNSGHQLLDRFSFIHKTEETLTKLEEYSKNGVNISKVDEPIYLSSINKETNKYLIQNNFFNIQENDKIVTALKLKKYTFESITNKQVSPSHSFANSNISNTTIATNNQKIFNGLSTNDYEIGDKSIDEIRTNYKASKHSQSYYSVDQNLNQVSNPNPYETATFSTFTYNSGEKKSSNNLPKLSASSSKSKIQQSAPVGKKRAKTPDRDKIVFIKSQLKNESANFSRIEIGEEGVAFICSLLHSKRGTKYKEIKLVKSGLNDESTTMLIKCLIDNNINVGNLNLSNNGLTDSIADTIIYMLTNYNCLKTLYLSNNLFSVQTKEKIKSYSSSSKTSKRNIKIFI